MWINGHTHTHTHTHTEMTTVTLAAHAQQGLTREKRVSNAMWNMCTESHALGMRLPGIDIYERSNSYLLPVGLRARNLYGDVSKYPETSLQGQNP